MIRKRVLVNKAVTDFCCVLNFMDTKGSNTVFLISCAGLFYSLLQAQNAVKMLKQREKRDN